MIIINKFLNLQKISKVSIVSATLFLFGCQSLPSNQLTAPVIPKVDNTYETSGEGKSKKMALMDAMHNANVTCAKQKNTKTIVINHDVKYLGVLDEQTGVLIDKVGGVIGAVAGQTVPSINDEADYQATVSFKCDAVN